MTAETKDFLRGLDKVHLSAHQRSQVQEAVRNSEIILSWLGALVNLFHVGPRAEKLAA
jgi:hypothetical protein